MVHNSKRNTDHARNLLNTVATSAMVAADLSGVKTLFYVSNSARLNKGVVSGSKIIDSTILKTSSLQNDFGVSFIHAPDSWTRRIKTKLTLIVEASAAPLVLIPRLASLPVSACSATVTTSAVSWHCLTTVFTPLIATYLQARQHAQTMRSTKIRLMLIVAAFVVPLVIEDQKCDVDGDCKVPVQLVFAVRDIAPFLAKLMTFSQFQLVLMVSGPERDRHWL